MARRRSAFLLYEMRTAGLDLAISRLRSMHGVAPMSRWAVATAAALTPKALLHELCLPLEMH
jgi:RES domain-containing protein